MITICYINKHAIWIALQHEILYVDLFYIFETITKEQVINSQHSIFETITMIKKTNINRICGWINNMWLIMFIDN